MKKMFLATVAALALSGAAQATTIDFESVAVGSIAEGTNIGGIVFSSAFGSGLFVDNFSPQSDNQGLAVFDDSPNFLIGAISGGASFLRLAFGNDDPGFSTAGDLATLRTFLGATLVGTSTIVLNRDDILNQFIVNTGSSFDNFSFAYTDAAGVPINLIEVVDNVEFTPGIPAVPEPASWALMIAGFGMVGGAMRRRKTSVSASYG